MGDNGCGGLTSSKMGFGSFRPSSSEFGATQRGARLEDDLTLEGVKGLFDPVVFELTSRGKLVIF